MGPQNDGKLWTDEKKLTIAAMPSHEPACLNE